MLAATARQRLKMCVSVELQQRDNRGMDGVLAMHSTEVQRSGKGALVAQRKSNQGESQQGSLDSRQVVSNRFQYLTKVVWRV